MSNSPFHLELLLEEPSLEEALSYILPKILGDKVTFKTHVFRGKTDLISKLPNRLKGYSTWLPENYKIIVLIDEDRQDCQQLKQQLETIAQSAGLTAKSSSDPDKSYQVINRIVIEELEAWFFGDVEAIRQAYPKVPNLANQAAYRDPDAIKGGTWEALERVLKRAGYHSGGLEKFRAAREIAPHMKPSINRSRSFQVFHTSLLEISP
jgi:hypothetical protein